MSGAAPRRGSLAVLVALALLAGAGLSGCGGGDEEATYCNRLQAQQAHISEMISGPPAALVTDLPMLERLAAAAPSDLADEWQTFVNAIEGLRDALRAAHVKAGNFTDGKPPAGMGVAQIKAISDAADVLSSDQVVAAAAGIEQQAKDVCKLQLGL